MTDSLTRVFVSQEDTYAKDAPACKALVDDYNATANANGAISLLDVLENAGEGLKTQRRWAQNWEEAVWEEAYVNPLGRVSLC